eukprot:m.7829 g.7829  ORF g.7829 m.7829 type:complete len:621 (+) comp5922_c0_seq1:63-1925(+)
MSERPPPPAFKPPKKTTDGENGTKTTSVKPKPSKRRRRQFKPEEKEDKEKPAPIFNTDALDFDEDEEETVGEETVEEEKEEVAPTIPTRPKRPPPSPKKRSPTNEQQEHHKTGDDNVGEADDDNSSTGEVTPIIPTRPVRSQKGSVDLNDNGDGEGSKDGINTTTTPTINKETDNETANSSNSNTQSSGPPIPKTRQPTAADVKRPPPPTSIRKKKPHAPPPKPARPAPAPARPAPPPGNGKAPPTRPSRPIRPTKPTKKKIESPPPLPARPTQGHPLYHYMVTGPRATILFDWEGDHDDDLTVKSGDIVKIIDWKSPEWIYGDNNGTKGIFPVVFADILEDVSISGPRAIADYLFEGTLEHELSFDVGNEIQLLGVINDEWMRGRYHGQEGAFPSSFVEVVEALPNQEHEGWPEEWKKAVEEAADAEESIVDVHAPQPQEDEVTDITFYGYDKEPIPEESSEPHKETVKEEDTRAHSTNSHEGEAKALFDYEGAAEGDLPFKEGDTIKLTKRLGEEWLEGYVETFPHTVGMFPSAYVEVVHEPQTDDDQHASEESPKEEVVFGHGTAITTWQGETDDDVPITEGEAITVLQKLDDEWLFVRNTGGKEGMLPASFVHMDT